MEMIALAILIGIGVLAGWEPTEAEWIGLGVLLAIGTCVEIFVPDRKE